MLDELFERAREASIQVQVEVGRVGWSDDGPHFHKGDPGGQAGSRHTLVKVTLARGSEGGEGGYEIWARLSGGLFRIPPKGTLVYLLIPHGMQTSPGAAMIIATAEDDPTRLEEDRIVIDYGDTHVIHRAKSHVLESTGGEWIGVGEPRSGGTPGVTIQARDGSGAVFQEGVASMFVAQGGDAKTLIQMTPSKVEILQKVSVVASNIFRMDGDIALAGPGKGFIMPATLVLGVPGSGSPPYAAIGTLGKTTQAIQHSTDT